MYQFSIRSLLLLTTIVAIIVWVLFAPPHVVGALAMLGLCLLFPPAAVAGIVYQRNYWRAFFIGAAPWSAALYFGLIAFSIDELERGEWLELFVMNSRDAVEVKLSAGPPLAIIFLSGLTAVGIRWWVMRRSGP